MKFKQAHAAGKQQVQARASLPRRRSAGTGPQGPRPAACIMMATDSAHLTIQRELSVESGALQLELETAVTIADSGSARRPLAAPGPGPAPADGAQ